MRIDPATLSDLELLQASDGGPGVLALIDRTQTRRGRSALAALVNSPRTTYRGVREAQSCVRFFAVNQGVLRLSEAACHAVEEYVDSNLAIMPRPPWGDRIAEIELRFRYPDVFREMRDGVSLTRSLFRRLAKTSDGLMQRDPPERIRSLLASIKKVSDSVLGFGQDLVPASDRYYRGELGGVIKEALASVAELDMWCSQGSFAGDVGWSFPEVLDSPGFLIEAEDLVHPLLPEGVGNPVRLTGGEPMVFLTGPNMAGKTTYLRAVGLLVALAQIGLPVPASRARLTPVDCLLSSLNPSDNLRAGLSYFMAEVNRVREAAELVIKGHRALVLFDEVFKGTNVRDALEASAEVISGFAKARGSGFIFSSHLAELAEVLGNDDGVQFAYFDGDIRSGRPEYPYQLRVGVSDKRFGMVLLRQAGIPEMMDQLGSSSAA